MSPQIQQRAVIVIADAAVKVAIAVAVEAAATAEATGGATAQAVAGMVAPPVRFGELVDDIFRPLLKQYRGRLVKMNSNRLFMTFTSAVAAVSFAADVQRTLPVHQSQWPKTCRLRFRMGVNLGLIVIEADDVGGDGVKGAAGLAALADAGGVVISGGVFGPAHRRLDQVAFQGLGTQVIAGLPTPLEAYGLLLDPSAVEAAAQGTPVFASRKIIGALIIVVVLAGALIWKLRPWQAL